MRGAAGLAVARLVAEVTWSPVSAGEPRRPAGHRGKGGKQGRNATGRRVVPPGVVAAAQAELLDGGAAKTVARRYGISVDFTRRLRDTVTQTDPETMTVLRKRLPDRMTILTAAHTEEALVALEDGRLGDATKATFGAKLAAEAMRHIAPLADGAGTTILNFIEALHERGGGRVTVSVDGPPPTPVDLAVIPESLEDHPPMPR